jgi:hypothetical protein
MKRTFIIKQRNNFYNMNTYQKSRNKSRNKRAVVSIALFIFFLLVPISGIMIHSGEHHPNAVASHVWHGIHGLSGILFTIFGVFHIVFNWRTLVSYFNKK